MDISGSKFQRFLGKINNLAENIRQDHSVVVTYLHICHEIRGTGCVQTDRIH
jgi:hypothetical protein